MGMRLAAGLRREAQWRLSVQMVEACQSDESQRVTAMIRLALAPTASASSDINSPVRSTSVTPPVPFFPISASWIGGD